ncbi:MAG: methyltransferase domain-containing protein [Actinomycetota bacterium]|nr:methyltransferase domain-containing protein [Actinomycetota bacterium]
MTTSAAPTDATADEFAERLFSAALGTVETLSVYLGDRLGWYRALTDAGPATAAELVARAGGDARYAREWLEQQAIFGILEIVDGDGNGAQNDNGDQRRFALPAAAREVLTDTSSLGYLAPLARMLAGSAIQLPALVDAYRNGGGVGWAQCGDDARESQADMNRPWFERELAGALQGVGEVDAVLRRPGTRIADIGCGAGWGSIALARAYPHAAVEGYDIDVPSVSRAEANAADAGLADRITFHAGDAGNWPPQPATTPFPVRVRARHATTRRGARRRPPDRQSRRHGRGHGRGRRRPLRRAGRRASPQMTSARLSTDTTVPARTSNAASKAAQSAGAHRQDVAVGPGAVLGAADHLQRPEHPQLHVPALDSSPADPCGRLCRAAQGRPSWHAAGRPTMPGQR